jgi:hypothetical protein
MSWIAEFDVPITIAGAVYETVVVADCESGDAKYKMTFAPSVATLVIVRVVPPETTAKADAGAVTELSASL